MLSLQVGVRLLLSSMIILGTSKFGSSQETIHRQLNFELRSIDDQEISMGKQIFEFEFPSKSGSGVSCVGCHKLEYAFSDNTRYSTGAGGEQTSRNTPALVNLYLSRFFMWDGRADNLSNQVLLPLENPTEMNVDWQASTLALKQQGLLPQDTYDGRTLVRERLNAYLLSLVSSSSRFDQYFYEGSDEAITGTEKEGMRIFFEEGKCTKCHVVSRTNPSFTDHAFHNIGVGYHQGEYNDLGRQLTTGRSSDLAKFKTPSLRNVSRTAPYMHDGSFQDLREVIEFYNTGGPRDAKNLDKKMEVLNLSEDQISSLVEFLGTLDSEVISINY